MADIDVDAVRDRLRAAMAAKGVAAKPLAKKAKLGETAVRDLLEGRSDNPRIKTLSAIAGALGVSLDYLLGTDIVPSKVVSIWSAMDEDDHEQAIRVLETFRRADRA